MLTLLWPIFLGWLAGGLINYLSDVLPRTRKFSRPRCRKCSRFRRTISLIAPVTCRDCGARASNRTWAVFLIMPVLFLLTWYFPPPTMGFYGGITWLAYFGLVAVIDLEHRLILHPISLAGGLMALIFGGFYHGLLDTVLGGAAGFGGMLMLYYFGGLFTRQLSRLRGEEIDEVALGFGDVNLAGIIGLLLGWPGVAAGLILGILIGGLGSGLYLIVKAATRSYRAFQALPYGPFLILGVVYLFYLAPYLT